MVSSKQSHWDYLLPSKDYLVKTTSNAADHRNLGMDWVNCGGRQDGKEGMVGERSKGQTQTYGGLTLFTFVADKCFISWRRCKGICRWTPGCSAHSLCLQFASVNIPFLTGSHSVMAETRLEECCRVWMVTWPAVNWFGSFFGQRYRTSSEDRFKGDVQMQRWRESWSPYACTETANEELCPRAKIYIPVGLQQVLTC